MTSVFFPYGERVHCNTKRRKCGLCGARLTSYNENNYCFIHAIRGIEHERKLSEEKKRISYKKHLVKMKQLMKKKRREKEETR
jgi:hypothetical protein